MDNAIVLIDYDNIWISCKNKYNEDILDKQFVNKVLDWIKNEEKVNILEVIAYANFDNGRMASDRHQTILQKSGIQTRHVMNGKDSADIALVCDALEKLYVTNPELDKFVIVSCDRDITSLINKIKAKGKEIILIPLAINIDWDVMKNYCTDYKWFEEIVGIPFVEPMAKQVLDKSSFLLELQAEIELRKSDINYSLWAKSLVKKYSSLKSKIDEIKDQLLKEDIIELYEYNFNGSIFRDGIRLKKPVDNKQESAYNNSEENKCENLVNENQ